MPSTQVVFLAFGPRVDLYAQIYFALRSAQSWREGNYNVTVLTDKPEFMASLKEEVDIIHLSSETLVEWRGEHDFLWRIKMKAIEHVAKIHPEDHILYFDSDIVVAKSLDMLISRLDSGSSIMHIKEKVIASSSSRKDKKLSKALSGFEFSKYKFDDASEMYNAGVMGVPAGKSIQVLSDAIDLCDALCGTEADKTYLEQLAFSIALKATGNLLTAEDVIIHYWGNKDNWNNLIENYLLESKFKQLSKESELKMMRHINFSETPYYYRIQATNRRFKKLADKMFSGERMRFFS